MCLGGGGGGGGGVQLFLLDHAQHMQRFVYRHTNCWGFSPLSSHSAYALGIVNLAKCSAGVHVNTPMHGLCFALCEAQHYSQPSFILLSTAN